MSLSPSSCNASYVASVSRDHIKTFLHLYCFFFHVYSQSVVPLTFDLFLRKMIRLEKYSLDS